MMFVIRRLQELARKKRVPLYVCFIDLTKAYDSIDRTLLWTVLARFGVPQNMISVIRQRLSKRVMFGRLAVQGPKRGGRPATSWVDCLQKNLEAFGAVPRKGKGRKWVAFGVVVKDGRDWMTAAKNMDKWHRGVERGAEALDSAWRRADLRQSNVQLQR